MPVIAPDEFLYGHLARSLAEGDGLSFYGASQQLRTALYVYLIAPSWLLASGESAYDLAKITGALTACAVVFPTWALARRLMTPRLAAVPVVLSVAGTWMLSAAGLMTENLAYPLGTAALVSGVLALRDRDSSRWAWAAFAFAIAATAARAQMAILFPILLAAILLDGAFADERRARLRHHRTPIAVLGVIVMAGLLVVLGGSASLLGPYTEVSEFSPPLGRVLEKTGEQWLGLATLSGGAAAGRSDRCRRAAIELARPRPGTAALRDPSDRPAARPGERLLQRRSGRRWPAVEH